MTIWYRETGKESDVVLSTAVLLYRNLADLPFVHRLNEDAVSGLVSRVASLVEKEGFRKFPLARLDGKETEGREEYRLGQGDDREDERRIRQCLEKAYGAPAGGALDPLPRIPGAAAFLLSPDGRLGINLCGEEHVTLVSRLSGLALGEALEEARHWDEALDEALTFAFSEKFGYYNAKAEHLGPGLSVEILLFLPALAATDSLASLGAALSGFGVRFSPLAGDLALLSCAAPLGKSEEEVISKLNFLLGGILTHERELRASLYTEDADRYVDKVYRALGLFKHARLLNYDEFMTAFSDLRLGVALGMVSAPAMEDLTALLFEAQPGLLGENGGRGRDRLRADVVQRAMVGAR